MPARGNDFYPGFLSIVFAYALINPTIGTFANAVSAIKASRSAAREPSAPSSPEMYRLRISEAFLAGQSFPAKLSSWVTPWVPPLEGGADGQRLNRIRSLNRFSDRNFIIRQILHGRQHRGLVNRFNYEIRR